MIHRKQLDAFKDDSRYKFILTGRRGGKTTLVCESILKDLSNCPPGGEVVYIGPTLQQAYELIWDAIEARMFQMRWSYRPFISKHVFNLPRGVKFYVLGAEKIRRLRGHKVFAAYMDEVAYFDEDLFNVWKTVRPTLTDLKGRAAMTSTPNGKGTKAYDFYLDILKIPAWRFFHWTSLDNPFLDPDEIASAKRELDEKAFKQEYEATWESFEGLAYYNFDEKLHISPCKEINANAYLDLIFDFNVNPTTLLLAQMGNGKASIKKEYSQKNSSTVDTVRSFCEEYKDKKLPLRIFGDAAGRARTSATGFSNYQYIEEELSKYGFPFQRCVWAINPPIIDRTMHVNSWLKNCYGQARIEIDPSCTDLIRDLSGQELEGRFPSSKGNVGHKADAIGYYICYLRNEETNKTGYVQL